MARDYHIKFDTEGPNLMRALRVTLDSELVNDPKKSFRIDLCDDPLYPSLVEYVKNNPVPEKTEH